jgi:hypothetical protein
MWWWCARNARPIVGAKHLGNLGEEVWGRVWGIPFPHLGLCGPDHHYNLSCCGQNCASIATPSDDIVRQCFYLLLIAKYQMFLACRLGVARPPCLSVWTPHPLLISLTFRNYEISKRNQYTDSHFIGRSRFRSGSQWVDPSAPPSDSRMC